MNNCSRCKNKAIFKFSVRTVAGGVEEITFCESCLKDALYKCLQRDHDLFKILYEWAQEELEFLQSKFKKEFPVNKQ